VICDLSRDTVGRGASSARGARELHAKGIRLWSVRDLHAKIYIFDKSAIVASANLSENSARLIEAGVLITEASAVERLRAYARHLQKGALPMNSDAILDELIKLEPKRFPQKAAVRSKTVGAASLPFFDNDQVWLTTAILDEGETKAEQKEKTRYARSIAAEHDVKPTSIGWMNEVSKRMKDALEPYHYILYWWPTRPRATKATYGWLEGPWQSIGGLDLGRAFAHRRYCVPQVKRRCRVIALDKKAVADLARVLGRKPPRDPMKLWNSINAKELPIRLSPAMIQRLAKFLRDRS
jgi:hypothetical protein